MLVSNTETILPLLASTVYSVSCLALPTNFLYDSSRDFTVAIQAFQFVDL